MKTKFIIVVIILSSLISCDKQIIHRQSVLSTNPRFSFYMEKDEEVTFFSEITYEYADTCDIVLQFDFIKNDTIFLNGAVDALDLYNKEIISFSNSPSKEASIKGKLKGNFIAPDYGKYTFQLTPIYNKSEVRIKKYIIEVH